MASTAILLIGLLSLRNLPLRLEADYLTHIGERQRLQLQDGSKVLLNTRSVLASDFKDGHRRARLLQGEAWFEVTGNMLQPLQVEAAPVTASMQNSAFAISYLDGEAQVKVQRGTLTCSPITPSTCAWRPVTQCASARTVSPNVGISILQSIWLG